MGKEDVKYDRQDPPAREIQRNAQRDKKLRRKNAPVLTGLPKGFPLGYWRLRQSREGGSIE